MYLTVLPTFRTWGFPRSRLRFPASSVLPRIFLFPIMDTSTGSFTGCPTADLDKKQEGSKQFPNFALFTTRLRRVRLSQSGGGKTSSIIWLKVLPQKGSSVLPIKIVCQFSGHRTSSIAATSHLHLKKLGISRLVR